MHMGRSDMHRGALNGARGYAGCPQAGAWSDLDRRITNAFLRAGGSANGGVIGGRPEAMAMAMKTYHDGHVAITGFSPDGTQAVWRAEVAATIIDTVAGDRG